MKREVSHWKKAESTRNRQLILKLLIEIGPMRFNELYAKINDISKISQPTLSKHLKELVKEGKIERYWNKNKGGDCYRINPESREKVEAQNQRHEAINFIEGISNPVYAYKEADNGKKGIAAFISTPGVSRVTMQKTANTIVSTYLKFLKPPILKDQKIAVVIMVRGKEGVES